jgi:drug/metabolite transporter (DMT)-like permease
VGVVLALCAAITYGTADFLGGLATRRARVFSVVLTTQTCGLVAVLLVAPLLGGDPIARDLWITALGGMSGVVGLLCFYRALAIGPMSIAAPLSAVLSALVPLATGVALGERPGALAWAGFPLALAAVVLFSRPPAEPERERSTATGTVLALSALAGLGFGGFFVALDKVTDESGLWPIVSARGASVLVIAVIAAATRVSPRLPRSALRIAFAAGVFDTAANVLVLLANRYGLLSVVAVISSLYPAATVALALGVLRERFTRTHAIASACAVAAVVAIALGGTGDAATDRQDEVAARGEPVMGFDLDRTTHGFDPTPTGGVETVRADDVDDTDQVERIRAHLAHEAERFGRGDFDDPAAIHGHDMPGLATLQAAGDALRVSYSAVPGGARLTYSSTDPDVVAAIHDWFAAQLADHGEHADAR